MKKIIFASILFFHLSLFGASGSDSIKIRAYVSKKVNVDVEANDLSQSINLDKAFDNMEIAKINISSNIKDGFQLRLQTSNNLNFKGNGQSGQLARYVLNYQSIGGNVFKIGKGDDGADLDYKDEEGVIIENRGKQLTSTDAKGLSLFLGYNKPGPLAWEPEFADTITLTLISK